MKPLYEIFSGDDLRIAEKIQRRRYQMLVHSYIYYELDENLISDSLWSQWATELAELQRKYPEIAKSVEYSTDFVGWDGSSGAFLTYTNKPNIISIAHSLVRNRYDKTNTLPAPIKSKNTTLFAPTQSKPCPSKTSTAKKKLF